MFLVIFVSILFRVIVVVIFACYCSSFSYSMRKE
nr:MAG TPA: hypothetical protein [Caudoviricetes sp.]